MVNLPQDMCECHIPRRVSGSVLCQYCRANLPPKALKATHWVNPWEDAITVPIDKLAECHAGLDQMCGSADGPFLLTKEKILEHWRSAVDKLDPYILPSAKGSHCMGIRYGAEGSQYLSPYPNQEKLQALLDKYRP